MIGAVRKAAVALLAGGALLAAAPAAQAALPNVFVGLCSDQVWWQTSEFDAGWKVAVQRRAGMDVMRVAVRWADLERRPGVWDYTMSDRTVRRLASNGVRMLAVLQTPPDFASSAPENPKPGMYPPKSNSEFAAFGVRMLRRYGRGGTFWAQNPDIPSLPVTAWQVWNEPNIQPWWASGPSADQYVRLLRTTATALRGIDPDVEIVSAGIPDSTLGIPQARYLRDMYAAGAKGAFDTLGLHGYAPEVDGLMGQLHRARDIMGEYKDSSPIWLTEFGWATGGAVSPFTTTEAGQAARTGEAIRRLASQREELRLRGFMLFTWQDVHGGTIWPHFSGLVRVDGSPKPAHRAFVEAVVAIREAAGEVVDPPPPPPPPPADTPPAETQPPGDEPGDSPASTAGPVEAGTDQQSPAGTDRVPDATPADPAWSPGNVFRVLSARLGRVTRSPAVTYFPERGTTLFPARTTLPFAVVRGCVGGCRIEARYDLAVRTAAGTWMRIRVPAQRFGLSRTRSRVLKLILTEAQLARLRRADRVRLRVKLRRRANARSSATRVAEMRLVLAAA